MNELEVYDAFHSSDYSDSDVDEECVCSQCESVFRSVDKGCSVWRSLCKQCHEKFKTIVLSPKEREEPEGDYSSSESELEEDKEETVTAPEAAGSDTEGDQSVNNDETNVPSNPVTLTASEWPADVWRAFNSNEVSLELNIYGIPECYVRKKYSNDAEGTTVHTYIDLELTDKAPLLFDYVYISAHFNKSKKTLALSRSIVTHMISGAKYILLTLLRSKCPTGKYSAVLMDVVSRETFRVVLGALRNDYVFVTEGMIDKQGAEDRLIEWVQEKGLVWDRTRANKTIEGRPDHESWAPGRPVRQAAIVAVSKKDPPPAPAVQQPPAKKKRQPAKKRGSRGGNANKKRKSTTTVAAQSAQDLTSDDVCDDEDNSNFIDSFDFNAEALRIAELESHVAKKEAMLEKRRKLEKHLNELTKEENSLSGELIK